MTTSEGSRYLRPQEVARRLHVSPKTVNRWADRGWLECAVTLGGHRRFLRSSVEAVAKEIEGETSARPQVLRQRAMAPETTEATLLEWGGPVTADDKRMEIRVACLEQQTEWLLIELERIRSVLISTAAMTNEALVED